MGHAPRFRAYIGPLGLARRFCRCLDAGERWVELDAEYRNIGIVLRRPANHPDGAAGLDPPTGFGKLQHAGLVWREPVLGGNDSRSVDAQVVHRTIEHRGFRILWIQVNASRAGNDLSGVRSTITADAAVWGVAGL